MKRVDVFALRSSRWGWLLLAALSLGSMCATAPAQESDDKNNWEKRWKMYESFLKRLDANKNGLIEEDEVTGRRKNMVEKMVTRLGMEPKFPLAIGSLREGVKKRFTAKPKPSGSTPETDRSSEASKSSDTDSSKRSTPQKPSVAGFGVQKDAKPAAGFGGSTNVRVGTRRASGRSNKATPRPSEKPVSPSKSSDPQQDDRITRYATSMMNQYDKNKNGRLERDEFKLMRSYSKSADTNKDGIITLDELKVGLDKYSQRRSKLYERDKKSFRKRISGTDSSGRFLTPIERLPDNLPDWFIPQDANADGQVSMAEFSDHWTERKVAEFRRHDLNGDGIITPTEWLKSQQGDEDDE